LWLCGLGLGGDLHRAARGAGVLWRLGTFDESSREFNTGSDPATGRRTINYLDPASDPVFQVGTSHPAVDWRAFHPGTANGRAGHRAHTYRIRFSLPAEPRGRFSIRFGLLAYAPRLPRLEVTLNGQTGWYYLRPTLTYTAGDPNVFYLPHYAKAEVIAQLPAGLLRRGDNELRLTAVDEPGDRDDSQPSGFSGPGSSGILYDAIELRREDDGHGTPGEPGVGLAVEPVVEPTIFFRRRADATLVEVVRVYCKLEGAVREGRVSLQTGQGRASAGFTSARAFGEQLVELNVPEFRGRQEAELEIVVDGIRRQRQVSLTPARQWTICVVPHEHLDVGYTDPVGKVAELHSRTLDQALGMIQRQPDFRFTVDGFWVVEQFLAGRAKPRRDEFLRQVRAGSLFVPAHYGCSFTGFQTAETMIRTLYPSYRFAAEQGSAFDHAFNTDVPSYSWSQVSVLAGAGLKYFLGASDAYRGPFLLHGRLHQQSPHWWEGPDGSRILTWYARHYHQVSSLFGMPPGLAAGQDALPRFLQSYDHPGYRANTVLLYGTQVENVALFEEQAQLAARWNQAWVFPKLRYTGFAEALDQIVREAGPQLPVVRGDGGPYWEDGLGANAKATAVGRETQRRAASAEKFAVAAAQVNPVVRIDEGKWQQLWRDLLLLEEHTWHADHSVSDPGSLLAVRLGQWKDTRATEAKAAVDHVLERALAAIADAVPAPVGSVLVFNPLNWARDGWVELDVGRGLAPVDLVTGRAAPNQVIGSSRSYQRLRMRAAGVPGLGYKTFALRPRAAPETDAEMEAEAGTDVLDNEYYRVTLDPESGGVSSVVDKELGRELVERSSGFRLNQYVYVTGADALPNRLVQYSTVAPEPELKLHPARQGRLVRVARTPLGQVAWLEANSVFTPRIATEIMLPAGQKRIEFINHVSKQHVLTKEGVYFAFPFAMPQPRFGYDTANGVVDPSRDLLPGAGREWFIVHHWVAAHGDGVSVALIPKDAPLVTLGDIARGRWPETFGARSSTIFSYVMNNYTPEGYQAGQGGEMTFRYVVTSGRALTAETLNRMGWEETVPLETSEIKANDRATAAPRPLPLAQAAFLSVEPAAVVCSAWKPAEDGDGTIVRLLETAGAAQQVRMWLPSGSIRAAWRCDVVERNQQPLTLTAAGPELRFELGRYQIATLRLVMTTAAD
jgi:hypothetical protein